MHTTGCTLNPAHCTPERLAPHFHSCSGGCTGSQNLLPRHIALTVNRPLYVVSILNTVQCKLYTKLWLVCGKLNSVHCSPYKVHYTLQIFVYPSTPAIIYYPRSQSISFLFSNPAPVLISFKYKSCLIYCNLICLLFQNHPLL